LLRHSRRDPERRRPYVLKEEWPGYGPVRAHSRSSTESDGLPHDPHAPRHTAGCGINKKGWIAWTSVPLTSSAISQAEFSCLEPGDPERLFDVLSP
jgi:hypothetical protein